MLLQVLRVFFVHLDIATFKDSGDLLKHQPFCGRQHLACGGYTFYCSCGGIGRGISLDINVFMRQHNPDPLVILSGGYPRTSADGQQ